MGGFFTLSRTNVALSTTNDVLTIVGASARTLRLWEVAITGMGTASAANELQVARSTTGTTPSAGVTAVPTLTNQVAAGFTNATAWVAQPTLGNIFLRLGVNANGGVYRWVTPPAMLFLTVGTEQLSFRSAVGTSNVSFHVIVEEL